MPDKFDPYRKWLGIPTKDQPPHHYRLLNIEPLEEDPDVISNAADARTAQLAQRKSGEHAEAATRILGEVAEARVCLLNAKKKAAYDEQLQSRLKPDKRSLPMAAPLPAGASSADYMPAAAGTPSSVASHASDQSERKQKQQVVLLVIGAVAVATLLVGFGIFQLTRGNGKKVAEQPDTAQPVNGTAQPGNNAATGQPTNDRDTGQPVTSNATPPKTTGQASAPEGMDNSVAGLFGLDEPEPSLGTSKGNETDPAGAGELTTTPEPSEVGPPATAGHGLLGEYFADQDLTQKVFTRVDPQIQFELGRDPPDPQVPKDFTARWTGWLVAPEPGDYKLSTFVNDGVRLWLDGRLVIDRWTESAGTRDEVDVVLTKDPHAIKIEYFDVRNESIMRLNWSRSGVFEEQPIPTEALLVDAGSTAIAALPQPGEPSSPGEPAAPEPPAERHAVPDGATQKKIQDDVKEILKDDLAKATTPKGKRATAQALYDQAEANKSDPNARFVLLRMGCGMAAEAGDVAKAMEMVGLMKKEYKINPAGVQAYVLKKATGSLPVGLDGLIIAEKIVDTATALAEEYAAADDYDAAVGFSELAVAAARKTKDTSLIRPAAISDREIKKKKKGFASTQKAIETLESNPNDPAANLTAGGYYCFRRNDWAKGIPLLAKGSDPELAAFAQKDSTAPTDAASLLALGDGWFDRAEKEENQLALQLRAKYFYEQVLPSLEGLQKVRIKRRVEAIDEAAATAKSEEPKKPAIVRAVIEEGNVALASRGTTVTGPTSGASYLLDGSTSSGYAYSKHPCEWTITFPKPYRLKAIGFKLRDSSSSSYTYTYRYAAAASSDGKTYFPLIDCSKGNWQAGWQRVSIPNRPIISVKLYGLHYSGSSYFYVEEFQAYCIIPR